MRFFLSELQITTGILFLSIWLPNPGIKKSKEGNMISSGPDKNSKSRWEALVVFLVGLHSILLGLTIYFFTDFFYRLFFAAGVENPFFVRQSGTFLFLAGFFYLYPLLDLKRYYNLILLVIFSKIVAVFFLISNAGYTPAPLMIYLAAFFDGLMAVVLAAVYIRLLKSSVLTKKSIPREEAADLKRAA